MSRIFTFYFYHTRLPDPEMNVFQVLYKQLSYPKEKMARAFQSILETSIDNFTKLNQRKISGYHPLKAFQVNEFADKVSDTAFDFSGMHFYAEETEIGHAFAEKCHKSVALFYNPTSKVRVI